MKKTILRALMCACLLTSCVSAKKYNLLMQDYQEQAERARSLEQEFRVLEVEYNQIKKQK